MSSYEEFRWYDKVAMHLAGVVGLVTMPLMAPIMIGLLIWYRCQFGKALTRCITRFYIAAIRFIVTHNLVRFCDSYDKYEAELWRLL